MFTDIVLNPMMIATVVMVVLCLLKIDVFFSIVASVFVCIFLAGANVTEGFTLFIEGMGSNAEIIYGLLVMGMIAVVMQEIKIGDVLVPRIAKLIGNKVWLIPVVLTIMGILSETVILVYVTFVPIFIPPFLELFNQYKVDRRMLTTVINAGLQIGYVCIPIGIGAVYMGIVQGALADNGLEVEFSEIFPASIPILISLIIGVIIAIIVYRKPREYENTGVEVAQIASEPAKMETKHWLTLCGTLLMVVVITISGYIPLAATAGLAFLVLTGVIKVTKITDYFNENTKTMAYGCFVLMAASGFGNVTRNVGELDTLIAALTEVLGGNRLIAAFFMLIVGLAVTMGIGTSFGTVPIVATILVPLSMNLGMSPAVVIMLVSAAGALGDSGSPASENSLVPTSVFNYDGQHNHVYDTCVPAFCCINIPIVIICTIAACIM